MTITKRVLLISAMILFLGLAVLVIPQTLHQFPTAQAASKTITLIGVFTAWNASQPSGPNPTITVTQGDSITVKLSTSDTTHMFALDNDKDGSMVTFSTCPTGDTCSSQFSPGYPTNIMITVNLAPGTYKYFCTYHSMMVGDFVVQAATDYSITSNPASLTIRQGSTGTSTITLTSVNGFSGTIDLTASVSPTGPTASLNPTSVSISSGSSGTSMLTISTPSVPAGAYTVTVSGNGTGTHTATVSVTVTVPDFSISANPGSLSIAQNSTAATTITISSIDAFSGPLNLTATVSPSGPSLSFSPAKVTLPSGGTAQSTLTISAVGGSSTPVATGTYTVTVTATNGTVSHAKTLQATVSPPGSPGLGTLNLPLTVLAGAGVIIVVAVAVTVFLVRRRTVPK